MLFQAYQDETGTVVKVWKLDLQLPVQSVPITTKVVSSNPVHGEMYSIQQFVSDLIATGLSFSLVAPVSTTYKTQWPSRYNWNIAESGVKHHKQANQDAIFVNNK